jgi:L-ascorbate metabolism protein UlaG (beta-lactamase superfamily)
MKVKWLGHSCFLISGDNGVRIITDPYESGGFKGGLDYQPVREKADIVLISHEHADHNCVKDISGAPEIIRKTGRLEIKGVEIDGILTCHDKTSGRQRGLNTVFCLNVDGIRVCHLGDLGHELSAEEITAMGRVDVLMIPVGGHFTIDAAEATRVAATLKPKIVFPMHFKTAVLNFPIAGVEDFLKGKPHVKRLDASEVEITRQNLPQETEVWVLKHSN